MTETILVLEIVCCAIGLIFGVGITIAGWIYFSSNRDQSRIEAAKVFLDMDLSDEEVTFLVKKIPLLGGEELDASLVGQEEMAIATSLVHKNVWLRYKGKEGDKEFYRLTALGYTAVKVLRKP